jgi:hypothetical protein
MVAGSDMLLTSAKRGHPSKMEDIALDAVSQLMEAAEWQLNMQSFIDSHCYQFIESDTEKGGHFHGQYEVFQVRVCALLARFPGGTH